MIKFYKDTYAALNQKGLLSSGEAICFVTDRQVLMMGGLEYGKDGGSIKIEAGTANDATGSRQVVSGTIYFFTGDQSVYRYDGDSTWVKLFDPTLSAADFISANDAQLVTQFTTSGLSDAYQATAKDVSSGLLRLESKLSAAYGTATTTQNSIGAAAYTVADNNVVVSDAAGIKRSTYVVNDATVKDLALSAATIADKRAATNGANLSTTLVNADTLAELASQIATDKTTVTAGFSADPKSDFIGVTSASTVENGTVWTVASHISNSESSSLKIVEGYLTDNLAIRKIETEAGYLATYGLFNEKDGQANGVLLGDKINLVKDQFLKNAEYVKAIEVNDVIYEYSTYAGTSENIPDNVKDYLRGLIPDGMTTDNGKEAKYENAWNRYLKLTFALNRAGDKVDSDNAQNTNDTSSDTDSVVFINVNELFQSYSGASGININQGNNVISAVIDPATEKGISSDAKGVKGTHYGNNAYLTVGEAGIKVAGIKQDISAAIEDLDNLTTASKPHAGANQWLTDIGVANGQLTGSYISAYASGVNFNGVAGNSTLLTTAASALAIPSATYVTVNDAIGALATHIGNLDASYDGGNGGTGTVFITKFTQTDGKITQFSGKTLESNDVAATAYFKAAPDRGTTLYTVGTTDNTTGTVQAALTSIVESVYTYFDSLDFAKIGVIPTEVTSKKLPSACTNDTEYQSYTVVNQIDQVNGEISGNTVALDAIHTGFEPIAGTTAGNFTWKNDSIPVITTRLDKNLTQLGGYTVSGAIACIANYLGSLDLAAVGTVGTLSATGTQPSAYTGSYTTYQIINQVSETNGQLSASTVALDTDHIYTQGIASNLPNSTTTTIASGAVKAPLLSGSISRILYADNGGIANILADYMSFHNADGNVIQ